jgi:hypothetical protein
MGGRQALRLKSGALAGEVGKPVAVEAPRSDRVLVDLTAKRVVKVEQLGLPLSADDASGILPQSTLT